ncbi:MAG: TIGR01440 family protein [Ruminococcaceae bacterium]|nr:TIGR01440 family protein [Oscillospiraceae bacterium]
MSLSEIKNSVALATAELIKKGNLKSGMTVVIGCSTSEVGGGIIGKSGSLDIAEAIYDGANEILSKNGIYLAAQCCEHLNRAIVVELEAAKNAEIVCAVPKMHAGGSFATIAYKKMKSPVLIEEIKADAGLDIGATLIGMHLKRVAVPLRLEVKKIGEAPLFAAYTRPKYIGGERAEYNP